MNFKEIANSTSIFGQGAAKLGKGRFSLNNMKEEATTPHYVMRKTIEMMKSRPSLRSGINQIINFLSSDIKFVSSDKKSAAFSNKWLDKREYLKKEIKNEMTTNFAIGTSYLQPIYSTTYNGKKVMDGFRAVPDPSIVYVNLNCQDPEEDYWLVEVPITIKSYDGMNPQYRPVHYIQNDRVWSDQIYCVAYPKDKYIQRTFGWSDNPYYGWGLLSSGTENEDIIHEILKNWALMSKYRAMGKKIISARNPDGSSVDPEEIDDLRADFSMLEQEESLITNKDISSEDFTFAGQDSSMAQELEFLRRDSGSLTVPNYMTPFSQDSSYATAQEAKVPFSYTLDEYDGQNRTFYDKVLTEKLKEAYPWLADDLHIEFGDPELYSRQDNFNMMQMMYNLGAATFNELRIAAGKEPVEGGDVWGEEPQSTDVRQVNYNKEFKELCEEKEFSEAVINPDKEKTDKLFESTKIETLTEKEMKKKADEDKKFKEAVGAILG